MDGVSVPGYDLCLPDVSFQEHEAPDHLGTDILRLCHSEDLSLNET